MTYETSTIILSSSEPAWEAKVTEIEAKYGIKRRSGLDAAGDFMIETVTPVVIDGTFVMIGRWPAPPLVLDAETSPPTLDSIPGE